MPFPGPFAYDPRPPAMQDDLAQSAHTSTTALDANENPDGLSPLLLAADRGRLAAINLLLTDLVLDINQIEPIFCSSALMRAAVNGHAAVVDALLTRSTITVDQTDDAGRCALHLAADFNQLAVLGSLLAAGANVNIANPVNGSTALSYASERGHLEVVRMLLTRKDIALDQIAASGWSALQCAVIYNQPEVVECLLAAGADVNLAVAGSGTTALTLAAEFGHLGIVRALLGRKDVALDQTLTTGWSALHFAAEHDRADVAQCLLAAGAKVNLAEATNGRTALIYAAGRGHIEVVKALLGSTSIALNRTDGNQASALHVAAAGNWHAVVGCLLEAGASMTLVSRTGKTALDLAIDHRHTAVVEVFLQHGAVLQRGDIIDAANLPFTVTFADLRSDLKTAVHGADRVMSSLLGPPEDSIDLLVAVLQSTLDVLQWLRLQGLRLAAARPVVDCLAALPATWGVLANKGQTVNAQQKRLCCASALCLLPALTRHGQAGRIYTAAGISAAGTARLTAVANAQTESLIVLAEAVMATQGRSMLENLMSACLAKTNLTLQLNREDLSANLVDAGFMPPLAQCIATSWTSALATLDDEPGAMPAGCSRKEARQYLLNDIENRAPAPFATALQRELDSPALVAALRRFIADIKSAEGLHMLFQIQCDQLRQYCAQLPGAAL